MSGSAWGGVSFAFGLTVLSMVGAALADYAAGLGVGVRTFRVVFETDAALKSFVSSGCEVGGRFTASARAGDKGDDLN